MAANNEFTVGTKVRFKAGPRSTNYTEGTISALNVGANNQFMEVAVVGREKPLKVRPGAATAV